MTSLHDNPSTRNIAPAIIVSDRNRRHPIWRQRAAVRVALRAHGARVCIDLAPFRREFTPDAAQRVAELLRIDRSRMWRRWPSRDLFDACVPHTRVVPILQELIELLRHATVRVRSAA